MNDKKIIVLDLTNCRYLGELHARIKTAFAFPDFYGQNWSAFWDMLWSECDAEKVEIIGENTMPLDFKSDLDKMHEILLRNKEEHIRNGWATFDYEIIN